MHGAFLMAIFDAKEPGDDELEGLERQDASGDRSPALLLLILPIVIFVFVRDRVELVIGVCFSLFSTILAIAQLWYLRKHAWFWTVILVIESIHFCLAYFAHWPKVTAITKLTILPFGVMYFCLTVGVIRFFGRYVFKSDLET
jgi:hypothetical protein